MALFGSWPLHFQYAIFIGVPVATLLIGVLLTFCLTRRRYKKREKKLQLQLQSERAQAHGPFGARALEAEHRYRLDREPTLPVVYQEQGPDPYAKGYRTSSQAGSAYSRSVTTSLPPYGPSPPPFVDSRADDGAGYYKETSEWPAYSSYPTAALPRSPSAATYRDQIVYEAPTDAYPDAAPTTSESRPGTARPESRAGYSSHLPHGPQSRPPLSRPGTALAHTRPPRQSPPLSKPATPYLIQRPGTAGPRLSAEPRSPPSPLPPMPKLEGRPATAQGHVRPDARTTRWPSATSSKRSPTPRFGMAGTGHSGAGTSNATDSGNGSRRLRHETLAPLHADRRNVVSPPLASSGSREVLLADEHELVPQEYSIAEAMRRPSTPELEPHYQPHHAGSEPADVYMDDDRHWEYTPYGGNGAASRSVSPREFPRSPSAQDQWGRDQTNDVPMVLRAGYSPVPR